MRGRRSSSASTGARRSRALTGLAVHPAHRGRGVADEGARALQQHLLFDLGFHRLQLEVYGFNERALRHAERVGFVREGVRRLAYRRGDEWVDGVLFGLVREDLERATPRTADGALDLTCRQATVHVSALEPALDFYVGVLGLELLERGDSFFAARAGDVRLSFFSGFEQAPGERARQTGVTLILATPDVEAAFRTVQARGRGAPRRASPKPADSCASSPCSTPTARSSRSPSTWSTRSCDAVVT